MHRTYRSDHRNTSSPRINPHLAYGLWNMHLISNASPSHFIQQLIHIHRIHLIHYASMLHHLNRQLLPSHSSIMHPSQSITALPRHQHHHMPSFSTSQPHPSHVHCHHSSNSPTTPSTPSKPVQTSPAPPARSNGNPKTSSAPASSRKTSNKRMTRSKTSSRSDSLQQSTTSPTSPPKPTHPAPTFPHLRHQGACSKCGKTNLNYFYTSTFDSRTNHPYKNVVLCSTCRHSTGHFTQAFTKYFTNIHHHYMPIKCHEHNCKKFHLGQFYTPSTSPTDQHPSIFYCHDHRQGSLGEKPQPYFGPPITNELLEQWG